MKKEIYVVLSLFFFFPLFTSKAQSVNEVVAKYNNSIDPNGKLDSVVQIQVDMNQKSFSLNNRLLSDETLTITYSIYGDNYSVNWSSGRRMDLNPYDISDWEIKNIIKTHFNILMCNDQEAFELTEANDSVFVIKKFSNDKEIYHEIDRINYNLRKRTIRYKGNETIITFSEFKMIEGIKVPTAMSVISELGTAEANTFNYRFIKAKIEKE